MKEAVYEPSFAEHFGVFYCTQLAGCFKLGSENAKRMACGRNLRRNSKRFYPLDDLIPDGILSDFGILCERAWFSPGPIPGYGRV
jgi:hypothetical protein